MSRSNSFLKEKEPKRKFSFGLALEGVGQKLAALAGGYRIQELGQGSGSRGSGFRHKGRDFIHHSGLPLKDTAFFSLASRQKAIFYLSLACLAAALAWEWRVVVIAFLAALTLAYFLDLVFSFFLIYRSYSRNPEIAVLEEETAGEPEGGWPVYTVLCPLYKEWQVVPQFIGAMKKLDYPQDKLQVMLLLEEDDRETLHQILEMALPENFETVVVPHSLPKTKPKAMNYGLHSARGEYLVVYDAEDVPDPLQLKKAVLAFGRVPPKTVCLQAKLNFYNPRQNLLTKVFTAEYSLWFDLVLPGLQSIEAPLPLGGTSNHFRADDLKRLKGWDAFNVTEDCDLGMRLSKSGFKTAIFNSTTWEEANSRLGNWFLQRSRWIKGYIQTYLVHMREFGQFGKNSRPRNGLFFQLVVGGKVASIFINPLMWAITAAYFLFRSSAGPAIESFFPAPVMYMGVLSFVGGNFLYLYYYMAGCARRGFDGLIKYVFLVPFYWLGMSLAAWRAVYEMMFKPHYWAKTVHGFHLHKKPSLTERQAEGSLENGWTGLYSGGAALVAALAAAGFLNFLFNAYLGRVLGFEQFGVVTFFNSLTVLFGVVFSALLAAVNHRVAYLEAKKKHAGALSFLAGTSRRTRAVSALALLLWLLAAPFLSSVFKIPDLWLWLAFSPTIVFGLLAAPSRGFLQGTMSFISAGAAIVAESLVKLAAALALVRFGFEEWAVAALPLSLAASYAVARILSSRAALGGQVEPAPAYRFPRRLFAAAMATGLSSVVLLNMDVVLAKYFLDPLGAGTYALLSLAGKIVFFFGSLFNVLIITYVGRDEGAGRDPNISFYKIFAGTAALVLCAWIFFGLLGSVSAPVLLGGKAEAIAGFLPMYSTAIALFTLANTFVVYHMARKHLTFPFLALAAVPGLAFAIFSSRQSVAGIVSAMVWAGAIFLGAVFLLHLLQKNGRFLFRNLVDLAGAFFPLEKAASVRPGGSRILVFNWRDIRHQYAGGAETYLHELGKRWVRAGHAVTLFCGNDGKCPRNEIIDGIQIYRRGGFYLVYAWAFVYYFLHFRGRHDVIIDSENGIPFFTPLYARERVVCLLHHVHQEVFRRYLSWPLSLVASVLENRLAPWIYRNTRFITTSDSSRKDMQDLEMGIAGIDIVHSGVDLKFLRPGKKNPTPLVLYLGRLKAYKSVDVLLKAFRLISQKLPQARLAVVGSGEEEGRLKKLAEELGLKDKAVFTGRVSDREKLNWLQRAWVLANPSLMEGWGITTIEANACGVPVVASNVPGLKDSVKNPHTGYLVEYGNAEAFGNRLLELLTDHSLRSRMGRDAVRWSKKFDWDRISERCLRVLGGEQAGIRLPDINRL